MDPMIKTAFTVLRGLLDTIERHVDKGYTLPYIDVSDVNSIEVDCTNLKAIYLEEKC